MVKPRDVDGQGLMACVNLNCQTELCSRCAVVWHVNETCTEYQAHMKVRTSAVDKEFETLRQKENWSKCPKCGLVIERTEGCFHMTHSGCPGADIDTTTGAKRSDFCYCCGEPLMKKMGEGWRFSALTQERHFEDGVFSPCVKANQSENSNNNNNNHLELDF